MIFRKEPKVRFEALDNIEQSDRYPLFQPDRRAEVTTRALIDLNFGFKYEKVRKHFSRLFEKLHDQLLEQGHEEPNAEPFIGVMLDENKISWLDLVGNFDLRQDEDNRTIVDENIWGNLSSGQLNARKLDGSEVAGLDEFHAFAMLSGARFGVDNGTLHSTMTQDYELDVVNADIKNQKVEVGNRLLLNPVDNLIINAQRRQDDLNMLGSTSIGSSVTHRFLQIDKQPGENGGLWRPSGSVIVNNKQPVYGFADAGSSTNIGVRIVVPLER